MTHHAAHVMTDAAGRVGQGLLMGHFALQDTMRNVRQQQRAKKNSVVALADRLQEARASEAAAHRRARSAEAELAFAQEEIRELQMLLAQQNRFVAQFREICGV
ncbi:hypothetical protein [Methylorubrum extorquens]|uniref:BZIP domain-containing protein n=1 Tax=Methylorubrum extorquens TaxID=408 RepID=A0AAX3WMJ6_METEX|nr:hypothetical protein [Methylorubrum extorquens]WHQ72049.1 hypothetical protein KEC54_11165 [Methylorubrum extorquens]